MGIKPLSTILLLFLLSAAPASAANYNVYAGESIQETITLIDDWDILTVHPGEYRENIVVNRSIELYGIDALIIAEDITIDVFEIVSDNVIIDGFEITGASATCGDGIFINRSDEVYITNNIIYGNRANIRCINATNCVISGNSLLNSTYGVHMAYSKNNVVQDNICCFNDFYGICLVDNSHNNTIDSNNASYCQYTGIAIAHTSDHTNVVNNTVAENNGYCGVLIAYYSNHTTMEGNNIFSNGGGGGGILLYEGNCNSTIKGNWITNNQWSGVRMEDSNIDNVVYNNYFDNDNNARTDQIDRNFWNVSRTPGQNIIGGSEIGGNYWSDYSGADDDHDGFGDCVYPISSFSNDSLPIVYLRMCGDVNRDERVTIADVIAVYDMVIHPHSPPVYVWAADTNGDERISISDVVEIYKKVVDPSHSLNCS